MEQDLFNYCLNSILNEMDSFELFTGSPMPEDNVDNYIRCILGNYYSNDFKKNESVFKQLKYSISTLRAQSSSCAYFMDGKATDHIEWLEDRKNQINWSRWKAYKAYKISKDHATPEQMNSINKTTNDILSRIEDPNRNDSWDIRGMVVGDVQAGKTSNYIGLLAKAVDVGYKVIIVLAGTTNDLRKQTQQRIDEGLLQFDTTKSENHGIRNHFSSDVQIHSLTSAADKGDYGKVAATSTIFMGRDCILYVVKKNVSVLKNVWKDINSKSTDGKINVPLIMIDDEADYASLNTKIQPYDPITNKPLNEKEVDPTAINRWIRAILSSFTKSVYIGYTATPFANIFGVPGIEKERTFYDKSLKRTIDIGEDLFPRNFICYLESPKNYYGPERVFGLNDDDSDRMPLIVDITKKFPDDILYEENRRDGSVIYSSSPISTKIVKGKIKYVNNKMVTLEKMPSSLSYAINGFILATAVRKIRNKKVSTKHNTMLIHIERLTNTHDVIYGWVNDYIEDKQRLFLTGRKFDREDFIGSLKNVWDHEFVAKKQDILDMVDDPDSTDVRWEEILNIIPDIVQAIKVVIVNGTKGGQNLNYKKYKDGLTVIAIGGDKLARGLTLEGLTTSYFLRSSKSYDTLSQMGRWFGYRDGYIDICRIYATSDILDSFEEIAQANYDLKKQFRDLQSQKDATPSTFGLKIRKSPDSLMQITATLKMKNKYELQFSFSDYSVSTTYFDPEDNNSNYNVFISFLKALSAPSRTSHVRYRNEKPSSGKSYCWENVSSDFVIENFLSQYAMYIKENQVYSKREIIEYIETMRSNGEIQYFTVALISGEGKEEDLSSSIKIKQSIRKIEKKPGYLELNKRRLPTGSDEAFDLNEEQFQLALDNTNRVRSEGGEKQTNTPSPHFIRAARDPKTALLLLYILQMDDGEGNTFDKVPGFMISFPETNNQKANVNYTGNSVYAKNRIKNQSEIEENEQ